ncbi:hypothetical protein PS467_07565 [Streptomyces luomodiensis]|uniref:Uncharacterized protein n=1 Tax=Streptomyces luomodiensis TaxID=3026192 RepID=A0ABY9USH1_9ACTN|nr:hypothetical protein [Streptomyces sp. SCA4-21]WNE95216.1 hypothetical protein PS467_07565 [Streptomyces sp. SCA4-21]
MNRNLRNATPVAYAALILLGFFIDTTVGIAVIIVGGILISVLYTATRGGRAADATPRRARRQRNRS